MRTYTEDGQTTLDIELFEDGTGAIEIKEMETEYPIYFKIEDMNKYIEDLQKLNAIANELKKDISWVKSKTS